MKELDNSQKLSILQKHALGELNDILDENFQYGQIGFVKKWIYDPNNQWKQDRVDKAKNVITLYEEKKALIK